MSHLRQAFILSLNMGRNPTLLSVGDFSKLVEEDKIFFRGNILGGTEPHQSIIAVPHVPRTDVNAPISLRTVEKAQWHCDCPDFRFTFFPHIDNMGEALGTFPEYIPNGRGQPRAIQDYGMCKHVMTLVNKLVHDHVFSPLDFMEK